MSITYSVEILPRLAGTDRPWYVGGRLLLDATEAFLLSDDDDEFSIPLVDPEALSAIRGAIPSPGVYLGNLLMYSWVRAGPRGPELDIYWLRLEGPDGQMPWSPDGIRLNVRPIPPEYDIR